MIAQDNTAAGSNTARARKASFYALAVGLLVSGTLLLWALFWPEKECDRPSCARQKYSVAVEIDALGQIDPINLEMTQADNPISLAHTLRGGGIEVSPLPDEVGLPYDPASGPLDSADLFQFASTWKNKAAPGADATLYALFVDSLIDDNGQELFGVMFDTSGREGFAIAPRTTARFFREHEPGQIAALQLRTFAHELLHALNRHHMDAAQMPDGRLTLEAPTRCISEKQPRGWSLREPPLMALSPNTIRFFQTATARDILPGPTNSPYNFRRATPTECEDARAHAIDLQNQSRWALAMRRLQLLIGFNTAEAAESTVASPSADIRIQAQSAPYPLGYPVAVRVLVSNTGEQLLPIVGRLNPRYGMLAIERRELGSHDWQPVEPLTWFEPTTDENARLLPGAATEETIPIYYGESGWTFDAAGSYEIRARLQVGAPHEDLVSEAITISFTDPSTPEDRGALQTLLDAEGRLDKNVGRLLYFGGRIGDDDDLDPLERSAHTFSHTALGGAMRLTLLSQRLRRPIDPNTGTRPAPDFEAARKLLDDICTDSGVAAMTSNLLEEAADLPASLQSRAQTDAAAWDGKDLAGHTVPTYSDPRLKRRGPSLHFCFNQAELRGPVPRAVTQLARHLRRERPARIVLVGHSDAVGTCRYNDTLALRRARVVQRALTASGLRRVPIEIVSVGERRPVSFASAAEAQQLNRRVEILVEGATDDRTDAPVIPPCPADHARNSRTSVPSTTKNTAMSDAQ